VCIQEAPQKKLKAPMQQHLTGVPMERVSLDVMGPLPKSGSDNRYILLICDYFTKWVEAYPIPNQEARTVADRFVKEFVCHFGVPRHLFTDQGSNFQSMLFNEVCELLDIEKDRTTPYHPQSDGFVERMNRTLEAMISMFVSPNQRDWDEILPYVMMAYRSAIQETTGFSPNLMMLGREVELPVDLMTGPPEVPRKSNVEYVNDMLDNLGEVHNVARNHIKLKNAAQKRNYDLRAKGKRYNRGDFVWMHNPARKVGISPKLVRSWEGPFLVIKRLSDVTYRVQKGPRAKYKVVHFDRLKPYVGQNAISWLKDSPTNSMEEITSPDCPETNEMDPEVLCEETVVYDPDATVVYDYVPAYNVPGYDEMDVANDHTIINELEIDNDNVNDNIVQIKQRPEVVSYPRRSHHRASRPARFRD
jgi:hypothetical protein